MKKIFFILLLMLPATTLFSQKIKHFEAFFSLNGSGMMMATGGSTRYVAVLEDNSIYWFSKEQTWAKVPTTGLPSGYDVIAMDAYSKEDGGRVIIVLSDNSMYWYSTSGNWKPIPVTGLPAGKKVLSLSSYVKTDGTRYVALLDDNTLWWYADKKPWEAVPMTGLPK